MNIRQSKELDKEYVNSVNKGSELRGLIKKANAIVAELEEAGYTVTFKGVGHTFGMIREVSIEKTESL